MKQRQLTWLGGALVLLLVIAYLAGVFDTEISTVQVPDVRIPAGEVSAIRATGSDMSVGLRRDGESWRLTDPVDAAADSTTVARVLEDLSALELRSVVSTNPERYGRYGVDSTGTEIDVVWEAGRLTLVVGENGPDFGSNYVRLSDDEAVYLSAGRLQLPENVDGWRDKTIVDLPPERVSRVSVHGPGQSYALQRQESEWQLTEDASPSTADSAAAIRYLERFNPLQADGFLESVPADRDSTYTVRFTLGDGTERVVELVPAEKDYAVTLDGGVTVYRMRGSRRSQYAPELSYFRDP